MADSTALQKSKLDADRQALRARVAGFRRQVSEDRDTLIDEARRVNSPDSMLGDHPKATVATSAAVGFVAARMPTKVPKPHLPGPAPVAKIAGKGASTGFDVLKVEAGVVIRDFVDGMFDKGEGHKETM